MNHSQSTEYREVWLRAWLQCAGCLAVNTTKTATEWADACLAAYSHRFPPDESPVNFPGDLQKNDGKTSDAEDQKWQRQ